MCIRDRTKIGLKPNSIPIAPHTIPKGITENICGATANIPLENICFLESIYLTGCRAIFRYLTSNLQSLYPRLTTFKYLSVGYLNSVLLTMI